MTTRDTIHQLVDQVDETHLDELHRADTRFTSSLHEMSMHPAYQRIIGLGRPALPMILLELQREPDYWFWALSAIAGEDPFPAASQGRLDEMAETWIRGG